MNFQLNNARRIHLAAPVLAALFSLPAGAQAPAPTDSTGAHFSLGSLQTIAGYSRFTFADLDARLASAGLPKAGTSAPSLGIGADVRVGRAMFGGSLQSLVARNQMNDVYRTRTSGSYSLFDAGFAIVRTRRTVIYPIVGVGVTSLSVNVRERGDFAFDDGLHSPRRELGLSGTSAALHSGVVLEQHFQRGSGSEFALSLRYGITRSVGSPSWQSDESHVTNGPSGVHGSYVRLAFSKPLQHRGDGALPIAATALQALLR